VPACPSVALDELRAPNFALRGMRGGIKRSVMLRLVLFIESVSFPLREECAGALNFVSEHIQWSSLFLERLREPPEIASKSGLMVAGRAKRCDHRRAHQSEHPRRR
jgi:hypothetical protein